MRHRIVLALAVVLAASSFAVAAEAQLDGSIVDPLLAIHAALAGDSTADVASQATALSNAAAALGPAAAQVASAARDLAAQSELAAMRRAYGDVNKALVAYMRAEKLTAPEGIRAAYCPMARQKWLQKDGAIRNPYYGKKMLECGGFTD